MLAGHRLKELKPSSQVEHFKTTPTSLFLFFSFFCLNYPENLQMKKSRWHKE